MSLVTRQFVAAVAALLVAGGGAARVARADTVWISSGGAGTNALQVNGVQIQKVEGGKLTFLTNGRETARDVRQVVRIEADGEPALNLAEAEFGAGRFDGATDAYKKALAASAKEWVKTRAAQRLTVAGQRANRFDAAASGYVALLVRDPGGAARASDFKPAPPNAQSTFIPAAVKEIDAALATPNLSAASKQALEAYRAELQAPPPPSAAPPAAPPLAAPSGDPVAAAVAKEQAAAASSQQTRQRLDVAGAALDRKDYPTAINEIRTNAKLFTEPRDQAQALYFLAEAQVGLAAAKNDATSWQDAAIAYLRVVAHFPASSPAGVRPFAARSLLKAGKIQEEKLADVAAARLLYEQLTKEFPGDPAAAEAKAILQRLGRLQG